MTAPSPADVRAAARRRQRLQELCGAAVRAVAGEPELYFRGGRPYRGRRPLPGYAPHLYPSDKDDLGSFRGAGDGLALRLRLSDHALHHELQPAEEEGRTARLVFEMLEQYRVEALAPEAMPGLAHNLRHRHERWSLAFHHSGLTETATGLLLYTVAQVCRSRITGLPVLEETEDVIEATRGALVPVLGHALAGLRRERDDQAAFAGHALAVARTVAAMCASAEAAAAERGGGEAEEERSLRSDFTLLTEFDDPEETGATARVRERDPAHGEAGYAVFTTAYDRERPAGALVRPELLAAHRARLDRRITEQGLNVPRLARELRTLLARPRTDGWDGAQEEGRIDGRTLAQLVSSPTERRLFRTEHTEPVVDATVTFLVDCSGSMKEHGEAVALLVDVFARALERAGADCEILGFTTGAWNGGRARRDWLRTGRPAGPGRLNERLHLVFKEAATPWRRARRDIAALLKPDLFREGLDGEAVAWAARRLAARSEGGPGEGGLGGNGPGGGGRRVLFVLSDGSPMDTATHLANGPGYLDGHLRDVVSGCERGGGVEVYGIGLGLDLSPFYRRSRVLDLTRGVDNAVLREVRGLLR